MTVREYIGARYVPLFIGEWDNTKTYEPLSIVSNQGNSYTSRQYVPIGIEINNTEYWALTGNYNAQIEQYRQEVESFDGEITEIKGEITEIKGDIVEINNDNWVTTNRLADESVTTNKLADGSVTNDKLADNSVTTNKLADESVTTNKLADENVTTNKLADESVTTNKLADESVTNNKLADNSVTIEKLNSDIIDSLDNLDESIEELNLKYKGSFNYPVLQGILRVPSNRFNSSTNESRRAQGFCLANNTFYVLVGGSATANASLYTRPVGGTQFAYIKELQTWHSSDIIYINNLQQFWVSHGSAGTISRFDSTFNLIDTFTIGSSATLLAYDKKTGKVYAHDYWGSIYEVNVTTLETTNIINSVVNNEYKQSIAAYNGIIYILYSYPDRILSYNTATGEIVDNISIGESNVFPIGETEGIDTDSDGNIFFTSHVACSDNSALLTTIYVLPISSNQITPDISEWRTNVFVGDRNSLFLSAQTPDGTSGNPFATIDEAILCMQKHPQINQIVVKGDHSEEQPFITFACIINGENTGNTKAKIGRIFTTGEFLFVYNIDFSPLVQVSSFIQGYRNGPISYNAITSSGSYATPTGHDIVSQYPVNTTLTNNVDW